MVVIVDVFMADDTWELYQRQLFVGQQFDIVQLGHVLNQPITLFQHVRMAGEALD